MADHEPCNLGLALALTGPQHVSSKHMDLSFTLCPKAEVVDNMNRKFNEVYNEDDEQSNCSNSRKKLRLTKEQSSLLEDSFKLHNTLTQTQKQTLADQLDLKPRQVEVWFQNRRARTKLKQTEVNCELLKKRCEILSEENRTMKKELEELRSNKLALYVQVPPGVAQTMCPMFKAVSEE